MTSIQPELWVETAREAVAFYTAAFCATVLHLVGEATTSSSSSASAMQCLIGKPLGVWPPR